jgi:spoIIIJ-associated protein
MKKTEEKIIKEIIDSFINVLGISGTATFEATTSDKEELIEILLETQDTSLVIGHHGEGLEALQLLLSLAISKKIDRFVRVSLEVGDYKKNRIEFLNQLTAKTKERALLEGRDIAMPELKSWERRLVHMLLQDDEEVETESIGEAKERVLVIKPKK